ncbi:MAG: glycoside hydrolase family 32 protein [Planctomycetota bacterium]|jgi:fructan beta-fructosidase
MHVEANARAPTDRTREVELKGKYLLIPVERTSRRRHGDALTVRVGDKLIYEYRVQVAPEKEHIHWWAFLDMSQYAGKRAAVRLKGRDVSGIDIINSGDEIPAKVPMYKEKLRPQFHFTSKRGWLNDPNGLIYYRGEYHMYYQHNPVSVKWGNMTWGHAVSKDMVHWKEQPTVLFPNGKTGDCFSGAAFIDRRNQLGRKTGAEDVIVAFYLRTRSGLCLAYSNDRGRTFTDYEGNPVLTHKGARIDAPRPFWYEPTGRWVAPTYDFFTNKKGKRLRAVGFYSSENLKDWRFESRVEQDRWGDELCGCVDFFQLPIDGDPEKKRWVMILIDGSYIVGTFDGHTFRTLSGKPAATSDRVRSLVVKGNYYATMTWHNMPNDRRVQITWMRKGGLFSDMPFNQQMTIPSELTLHSTEEGPRLRMNPIKELESLRTRTHGFKDLTLKAGENPLSGLGGDLFDLEVEFEPAAGAETVFNLRGIKVAYNSETQTLSCGGQRAISTKLGPVDGLIRLRAFLDRTAVEVYGNDGRVYIPLAVFPAEGDLSLSATCSKGEVTARDLRVHELKSAWE